MPHKCMNCGKIYESDDEELINGCSCGSNLFIFIKEGDEEPEIDKDVVLKEIDEFLKNLVNRIKSSEEDFDLESITVVKDGIYEINLKRLLEEIPLIIEFREGTYKIHLASAFRRGRIERFDPAELEDEIIKKKGKRGKRR